MGTGTAARALSNIHAPTLHVWWWACRADATLSAKRGLKLMQHFGFVEKSSSKRSGFAIFSQFTTNHLHFCIEHEQIGSKEQKQNNFSKVMTSKGVLSAKWKYKVQK